VVVYLARLSEARGRRFAGRSPRWCAWWPRTRPRCARSRGHPFATRTFGRCVRSSPRVTPPATVNLRLSAVRGILQEAWKLGQIPTDAYQRLASVEGVRGSRLPAGRDVSIAERQRLLDACRIDPLPARSPGTRRCSNCSPARASGAPRSSPSNWRTSSSRRGLCGCRARATRSGRSTSSTGRAARSSAGCRFAAATRERSCTGCCFRRTVCAHTEIRAREGQEGPEFQGWFRGDWPGQPASQNLYYVNFYPGLFASPSNLRHRRQVRRGQVRPRRDAFRSAPATTRQPPIRSPALRGSDTSDRDTWAGFRASRPARSRVAAREALAHERLE